jgi:thioredoxin 1
MATVDLSMETLESTIEGNEIVLIDFWAEWCGPCKMFAPTYEKVSEQYPNIVFAKVDTEAHQQLAAQFQIRSIPTLVVFKDQVGIFAQPGALPEDGLTDLIDQVVGLDMDEVRKEIAAQEKADAPA